MNKLVVLLLSIIVLALVLRVLAQHFSARKLATGLQTDSHGEMQLAACDQSMNCVSSTSSSKRNRVNALSVTKTNADSIKTVKQVIEGMTGAKVIKHDDTYLHATFTSRLLAFVDDVEFLLDENSGTLQLRSASRLGRSDLGANRARVEHLTGLLAGKL